MIVLARTTPSGVPCAMTTTNRFAFRAISYLIAHDVSPINIPGISGVSSDRYFPISCHCDS